MQGSFLESQFLCIEGLVGVNWCYFKIQKSDFGYPNTIPKLV